MSAPFQINSIRPRQRFKSVKRRPGSKISIIEQHVLARVGAALNSPSTFAIDLTISLGFRVTRQDVWKVLRQNNYTSTLQSPLPSGTLWRHHRRRYLRDMRFIWMNPAQLVFWDERKKLSEMIERAAGTAGGIGEFEDSENDGDASVATLKPVISHEIETIACVAHDPDPEMAGLTQDGRVGTIRCLAYTTVRGAILEEDILNFFEHRLAPRLGPFPGPRSVVCGNFLPTSCALQDRLEKMVNSRGAFLIFNPPDSPDLNPLEKFWEVVGAACLRRMIELAAQGSSLTREDLHQLLQNCRLTLDCYAEIFNCPENPFPLPFL